MDLQKVREDAETVALFFRPITNTPTYAECSQAAERVVQALTELEKSADGDAREVARIWHIDFSHNSELLSED